MGRTFGNKSAGAVVQRKHFLCALGLVAQQQLGCLLVCAKVVRQAEHGALCLKIDTGNERRVCRYMNMNMQRAA